MFKLYCGLFRLKNIYIYMNYRVKATKNCNIFLYMYNYYE
ncbi:hypothetical protein CNEO2_10218 [Clostridium neonatale]|uniref:Uncharacterized protein n=1 Tax=Clostridium neonatale TaxID=137838 RepID=A0AA86JGR7_9CLOT|nr:hypothetical protein CNEO_41801 [Clostridium neonatale]CAI3194535.1 hypothetical protein CNEO2_170002 [Clostridium neonatale]CAI3208587.1 hypothetical protein CNEO2_30002 [Clostridium neonatale]CAI3229849.1 hypothetical protein CNEO2_10218 [Clostridium neonatale]CAI3542840.1 hypothetical protein CNEO4_10216 [Clostridium neonatale]